VIVPTPTRPLRADAARNRELLLAAAEEELAERGVDASIADIARRAGVAKGTVFRHFATKEELLAAVFGNHLAALTDAGARQLDAPDAGAALLEFVTAAADAMQRYDLTYLRVLSQNDPRLSELRDRLHAIVSSLVDRARAAGAVRGDITGTDVFLLLCAPAHTVELVADPPPDLWRRYLAIVLDGLRPEGATALPHPAPAWP
jgi:AcrR family transcriptional regulator